MNFQFISMGKGIKNYLFDLFFPKQCLGCQKEGSYLCDDCQGCLEISGFHQNPERQRREEKRIYPLRPYSTAELADLYFAADYQKPLTRKLIQKFKYEPFIKELAEPLASLIIEHFQLIEKPPSFTDFFLVPVPLGKKRLRWRGFNQAEEIGDNLAQFWGIPLLNNVLVKIKNTLPQVELSDKEREENIKGAFLCQNPETVRGKKILLINDVYTSGATMTECARVLKKAGSKEIIGLAVARG